MTGGADSDDELSLPEQVAALREDVDVLLMARSGRVRPPAAVGTGWQEMPAAAAAEEWTALVEWVDDLVDRYALDETVPVCWYAHGAMVEELHALHVAWLAAYHPRSTTPTADRVGWHELLARALARIRAWDRHGCVGGTHRPDEPVGPTEDQRTTRAWFVHADLQARARRDGARAADPP